MENKPQENNEEDSLENLETTPGEQQQDSNATTGSNGSAPASDDQAKRKRRVASFNPKDIVSHLNIYFLLFILILVIAGGIVFIGMQRGKEEIAKPAVVTTPLTNETLDKIKGSDAKVGDPKQTLNIESNAIFSGKVLLRDSLDVAGTIRVGGELSLPGITVSGTSNFDQIQANRLAIAGDTTIQGLLTIQQNLTVTGSGTFGGPISAPRLNVDNLQLSGDLLINRHIDTGGPTPNRNNGNALGSGGTSSINGSDTSGTVTINIGGSPSAGCFITVNFANAFNATPHVVVTPVGSAAANLRYYVNRSSTNFSICSTNAASAGTSFSFDYIALD